VHGNRDESLYENQGAAHTRARELSARSTPGKVKHGQFDKDLNELTTNTAEGDVGLGKDPMRAAAERAKMRPRRKQAFRCGKDKTIA
jgi:hypothetical protein